MRPFVICLLGLWASGAQAGFESQEALAARIEALGFHETDTRRHKVAIDDCEMTTYVYEDWEDQGKVLWSSFAFSIGILVPPDISNPIEKFTLSTKVDDRLSLELIVFKTRGGTTARHEMAARRNPKGESKPSPRQDVDNFVFQEKSSFYIIHQGIEQPGQAEAFVKALYAYQREFCLPIG